MTDLEEFIAEDEAAWRSTRAGGWRGAILVLSFGDLRYGVLASAVESVVAYREPSRVPHASPALAGILQDRGRMLALMRHPAGFGDENEGTPVRVLVCVTQAGRVGLPATATHTIRTLWHHSQPAHGDLLESEDAPVTFLDVETVAGAARGGT